MITGKLSTPLKTCNLNSSMTRYKIIKWDGTDATFKTYLKLKLRDSDDTSLLDGKAFFPTRKQWELYMQEHSGIDQVSCQYCSRKFIAKCLRTMEHARVTIRCTRSRTCLTGRSRASRPPAAFDIVSLVREEWLT